MVTRQFTHRPTRDQSGSGLVNAWTSQLTKMFENFEYIIALGM